MTNDRKPDPHPDSPPNDEADDRGEGGDEPDTFTTPGLHDGHRGTSGVIRNQDDDAQ